MLNIFYVCNVCPFFCKSVTVLCECQHTSFTPPSSLEVGDVFTSPPPLSIPRSSSFFIKWFLICTSAVSSISLRAATNLCKLWDTPGARFCRCTSYHFLGYSMHDSSGRCQGEDNIFYQGQFQSTVIPRFTYRVVIPDIE